ncbi:MAG: redoxin domain-containing protein [Alphaproteobacteria bacterium]|nr:redoxin domain-containing protein [Alphaproteobacteria bacterium]
MQLSSKDKSLLLLIASALIILWLVFLIFSRLLFFVDFRNSDITKLSNAPNQEWFNTSRPLALDDFRNRVILLDFWTYSCISCIQTLPEIKHLEERFGNRLLIIGVHSARFSAESGASIKKAILKHEINFPVINDSSLNIWNSFGIKLWPSFVLINPHGNVEKIFTGVNESEKIKDEIKKLVRKYDSQITREPLPVLLERYNTIGNVLSFPTKIEYVRNLSYKSHRAPALIISNSGQHNIIISSLTGEILTKIGSGRNAFVDGSFDAASFAEPHGTLFSDGKIYVADSGNHALRVIDLKEEKVSTLIGSGVRGRALETISEDKNTNLSYPYDLEFFPNKNSIVIANAGTNQILTYNFKTRSISALADNLNQTSDLAAFGEKLYFLDAMSSSLNVVTQDGEITNLVNSELQHPLGLMVDDTGAYITDSYNHVIRKYDFISKQLRKLTIKSEFDEPDGITSALDRFYIADSNNNRILVVNRGSLNAEILNVMPALQLPKEGFLEYLPNLQKSDKTKLKANTEIVLKVILDEGWKINEQGPSFINLLEITGINQANLVASFDWNGVKQKEMKLPKLSTSKNYLLQGTIYFCEDKANALCYIKSYEQEISAANGGGETLEIKLTSTTNPKS